jgi:hypothetical protein
MDVERRSRFGSRRQGSIREPVRRASGVDRIVAVANPGDPDRAVHETASGVAGSGVA